jgi:hypothetical protein
VFAELSISAGSPGHDKVISSNDLNLAQPKTAHLKK